MGLLEDNDKLKLAKAVFNHTKTVANEYIEKHSKSIEEIDTSENEFYEIAMIEIEEDIKVKSTWARALAQTDGDKEKLEPTYIKLRVAELVQEEKERIIFNQEFEKQKKIREEENIQLKLQEELKQQQRLEEEKEKIRLKKWFEEEEKKAIINDKLLVERKKEDKIIIYFIMVIFIVIIIILGLNSK